MSTLGKTIKMIRTYRGLKQTDFSDVLSSVALSNIENDKAIPSKENLKGICKILKVPVAFVLLMSLDEKDVDVEDRQMYKNRILELERMLVPNAL